MSTRISTDATAMTTSTVVVNSSASRAAIPALSPLHAAGDSIRRASPGLPDP